MEIFTKEILKTMFSTDLENLFAVKWFTKENGKTGFVMGKEIWKDGLVFAILCRAENWVWIS